MKGKTFMSIILLLLICLVIMTVFKYATTPISELPLWVYWLIK